MNLPITRVVLYKHGVGYFEREGGVEGDASLALTFKQSEVSDVLKSLTVLDLDDHPRVLTQVALPPSWPAFDVPMPVDPRAPDRDQVGRPVRAGGRQCVREGALEPFDRP